MNSLELFSGCGGLAKGLELSGFKHERFVEWNKDACNTLRLNFESEKIYQGDVQQFDFSSLREINMVAGGPPCQPFSLGGKHKAHKDNRDMFPFAIKAIEVLRPKAFIFENVKGLLRDTFSDYFDYIILRLSFPHCAIKEHESWLEHLYRLKYLANMHSEELSYKVQYKLLNAADYGVPQIRERVVIVGIRSDIDTQWTYPEPTHSQDRLYWDKFVTFDYWKKHGLKCAMSLSDKIVADKLYQRYGVFEPRGLAWNTIRDALHFLPPVQSHHSIDDHIFRDGARKYYGHTGSEIDLPAKTLKAGGHGVPGGENMIRFQDGSVRYFTVHEAKLLQTFSSDFKISGTWGEAMRQIGNAVPVKLAKILGDHLMKILEEQSVTSLPYCVGY